MRIHTRPARFMWRGGPGARARELARGDAFRLERLEAEVTKRKLDTRGRNSLDAAFVRLAELGAHRLQHGVWPLLSFKPSVQGASRRGRPASPSASFLSCAI